MKDKKIKIVSLEEYKLEHGLHGVSMRMGIPSGTIQSRLRSMKNWQVLEIEGKLHCVMFDKTI